MTEAPSQADRLYALLSDFRAHRTDEIVSKIYSGGALARVGARIWDVQKKYKVAINGWHDRQNAKLYWYQMERPRKLAVLVPPALEAVARINATPAFKPKVQIIETLFP